MEPFAFAIDADSALILSSFGALLLFFAGIAVGIRTGAGAP